MVPTTEIYCLTVQEAGKITIKGLALPGSQMATFVPHPHLTDKDLGSSKHSLKPSPMVSLKLNDLLKSMAPDG